MANWYRNEQNWLVTYIGWAGGMNIVHDKVLTIKKVLTVQKIIIYKHNNTFLTT